jgi:hypothetical protein
MCLFGVQCVFWRYKCLELSIGRVYICHDVRSLRHVAHYFKMRDTCLVRHVTLLPNGRHALIRRVALFFAMGNTWVAIGRHTLIRCIALYLS